MMPYCQYKRCKKVSDTELGVIQGYNRPYLCGKHLKKVLRLLNIEHKADGDYR